LYISNHITDTKATPVHNIKSVNVTGERPKIVRMEGIRCNTVRKMIEISNTQGPGCFYNEWFL
jgi:hypothetical protein